MSYVLLQIPPAVQTGQYWRGFDARPNFHRRRIQIIDVQNDEIKVGFCDTIKDNEFQETCVYPESMFSNVITGFAYFTADNRK